MAEIPDRTSVEVRPLKRRMENIGVALVDRIRQAGARCEIERMRLRDWLKSDRGEVQDVIRVAAAVIIIAALLVFGKEIVAWIKQKWDDMKAS